MSFLFSFHFRYSASKTRVSQSVVRVHNLGWLTGWESSLCRRRGRLRQRHHHDWRRRRRSEVEPSCRSMSSRPSFLNVHGHGQLHGLWPHREAAGQLAQQTVVEQPRSTNIVYSSEVIHFRSRFVISEVKRCYFSFSPLLI